MKRIYLLLYNTNEQCRSKIAFQLRCACIRYVNGKEFFCLKIPPKKRKKKLYSIILSMTHDHYMEYFVLIKCYNDSYRLIIDIVKVNAQNQIKILYMTFVCKIISENLINEAHLFIVIQYK
jgi:Mor family transcriptional regulator